MAVRCVGENLSEHYDLTVVAPTVVVPVDEPQRSPELATGLPVEPERLRM